MERKYLRIAFISLMFVSALWASQIRWKHYKNARWGFCISYPADWESHEGVNKAGIAVHPRQDDRANASQSEITVGALPNILVDRNRMSTLEEGFDGELKARREGGTTDIVVITKEKMAFNGLAGLYTKVSYKEADTGTIWVDEEIAVRTSDEIIYGFELKCRPEELKALEPIFNSITFDTFKFSCPRKHLH